MFSQHSEFRMLERISFEEVRRILFDSSRHHGIEFTPAASFYEWPSRRFPGVCTDYEYPFSRRVNLPTCITTSFSGVGHATSPACFSTIHGPRLSLYPLII